MRALFDSESDSLGLTQRHFYDSLRFPLAAIGFIWLIHAYLTFVGADPGWYGIMPRRLWGLRGIVTAPLVHGSWGHLASNTFPLFVLTAITLYFYRKVAMRAFWMIYFLTGISVWLLARPVLHIGASGVVYGLVAFIFWNGIFRRSLRSIILALIVMVFYSGMFLGILPDQDGISWESHLLGSLAGIFTSFWFKGELEDDELERHDPFAEERNREKEYFLPRDIFNKTKAQRALEAEEEARLRAQQNDTFFPPFWNQDRTW
ncbi:MAG: rhomboid family intramembrane serine protease [Lewinellaceae bacterium]|nr:rhomboid family intramembrane serine protease [Lewinellaceae bacterium]MCB9330100.1 rhomboid family intramembrane serine protease [Lewinellaceae bacterium]